MLIAMFFVILSSECLAIISSTENRKIATKAYAVGHHEEDNLLQPVDTSNNHARLPLYGSLSSA